MIWWGGEDWEFHACVRCGRPLRSAKAREAGYGPECGVVLGIGSYVRKVRSEEYAKATAKDGPPNPVPHNRALRKVVNGDRKYRAPVSTQRQPTKKQLSYLRDLALKAGMTFVTPMNSHEASMQIDWLKGRA